MEQLRLLYRNSDGDVPVNADLRFHRVFLCADEEVLSNADVSLVKCFEADCEAADYVSRNSREGLGGQYYFAWMPMKVAETVALWKGLEDNDLERLAPRLIEENSPEIWESVAY